MERTSYGVGYGQGHLVGYITALVLEHPYFFAIQLIVTLALLTRARTQWWSTYREANQINKTLVIPRVPYWAPLLGNTLNFATNPQSWLLEQSRSLKSSAFVLNVFFRDYIVITSPALLATLSESKLSVSTQYYQRLRSQRFFANSISTPNTNARRAAALRAFRSDTQLPKTLATLLESHAYNLISPSKSWVDQAQWERTSDTAFVSDEPTLTVTAHILILLRDFAAHVFFSTLLGSSFLAANPGFVTDFFAFTAKYSTFMTGLPYWIAPGLGPPALSREKCLIALNGLVTTIRAEQDQGQSEVSGTGLLYDIDEVHPAVRELVKQASSERKSNRSITCEVLELLFDASFENIATVVWTVFYLFMEDSDSSTARVTILQQMQESRVVTVIKPPPSGLPFEAPPRLEFSLEKAMTLQTSCPMLVAAMDEVARLEFEREEYFVVATSCVLQEATSDGQADTGNKSERLQLNTKDHIYAAHGATNHDSRYFDRPRRFFPGRYLKPDGQVHQDRALFGTAGTEVKAPAMLVVMALLSFFEFGTTRGQSSRPRFDHVAGFRIPKQSDKATDEDDSDVLHVLLWKASIFETGLASVQS